MTIQRDRAVVNFELAHRELLTWIQSVADLTRPDSIYLCNGSDAEWKEITDLLVKARTLVPLKKKPNSFWCASDPTDVARVVDRTFICSVNESDAGPTNNWMAPAQMKETMSKLYDGCMRGQIGRAHV